MAALLIKTAIDGFKLAEGGGSLMTLIGDIEKDIAAYESARSTNVAAGTVDPPVPAIAEAPVA